MDLADLHRSFFIYNMGEKFNTHKVHFIRFYGVIPACGRQACHPCSIDIY